MTWTQPPARRVDLLLEYKENAQTGSHTSAWVETGSLDAVRVAVKLNGSGGSPYVAIQEAGYDPDQSDPSAVVVAETAVPIASRYASGEVKLTARYFRLILTGGPTDNSNNITVRGI